MIVPAAVAVLSNLLFLSSLATPLRSTPEWQLPLGPQSSVYPHHDLHRMNDDRVIPSPAFGVGSVLKGQNVTDYVVSALNVGYRHFDNAAFYATEQYVGLAIKAWGGDRKELYVTSKWDKINGRSPRTEVMESLRLLQLDYLDLYLIHSPRIAAGNQTAVWSEFEDLQKEGLVRSIGVSNYYPSDLTSLLAHATIPPAVNQIRYHVYNAQEQAATVAFCAKHNIIIEAYGALEPLKNPGGPGDEAAEEAAEVLSQRSGKDINSGQAIMDWVKSKGMVAVTTSTKPYRQEENFVVFDENFPTLTSEEIAEFEKAGMR